MARQGHTLNKVGAYLEHPSYNIVEWQVMITRASLSLKISSNQYISQEAGSVEFSLNRSMA